MTWACPFSYRSKVQCSNCRTRVRSSLRRNAGSKAFVDLTYLELVLLYVKRLRRVSSCKIKAIAATYKIRNHDLGLAASWASGNGRRGLVRLGLLGGLGNASDGCLYATTGASAAVATSATGAAAGVGLEDVIERGVELVGHCGWLDDGS